MTEALFRWSVAVDHPAFAGHFPGNPIVPGVVLLDRAILCAEASAGTPGTRWQIGNAKFLSPVGPGETLDFVLTPRTGGGYTFVVRSAGPEVRDVASGSLSPAP